MEYFVIYVPVKHKQGDVIMLKDNNFEKSFKVFTLCFD